MYDSLRKHEETVEPNGTRPECDYDTSMRGTCYRIDGEVAGQAHAAEEITFGYSTEGSAIQAPIVVGGEVAGRVDGRLVAIGDIALTGEVFAREHLMAGNVFGMAVAKVAKVLSVQPGALVNAHNLKVRYGVWGVARGSSSLTANAVHPGGKAYALDGTLKISKRIDGIGKGLNVKTPVIGPKGEVGAEEVVTTDLYGKVMARRLKIMPGGGLRRLRIVNETGWNSVLRDPNAPRPEELYQQFDAQAIVDVFNFPGLHGDISLGRLVDLYRTRGDRDGLIWIEERHKKAPETLMRVTHGIFLQKDCCLMTDFSSSKWEIRDLATGQTDARISVIMKKRNSICDCLLLVTPGETIEVISE